MNNTPGSRPPHAARLQLQPVTLAVASDFIRRHHRHLAPPQGHKFSLALYDGERIVAVATVGRPVARRLDDGFTLEVTRLCSDGTPNACSRLLGTARRATQALGYRRLVSYTQATEPGTSLRAAGWRITGRTAGGRWSRVGRFRPADQPRCAKWRWEAGRADARAGPAVRSHSSPHPGL